MRNGFKLASIAGALMLASGAANAQLPDNPFQNLTKIDGTNQYNLPSFCGSGAGQVSCSTIAAGDGFLQVMVGGAGGTVGGQVIPGADSYIMTYIADGTGDNSFVDHSYVRMSQTSPDGTIISGANGGIAAQQRITEVDATRGGGFDSTTIIATQDWAKASLGAGSPDINITQTLIDLGGTGATAVTNPSAVVSDGDNFVSTFGFQSVKDANGVVTGSSIDLGQIAELADPAVASTAGDKQTFAYRQRQGSFVATASTQPITIGNDSMSWGVGDNIKAMWMGQTIAIPDLVPGQVVRSDFGYVGFDNVSDTVAGISSSGFAAANAAGPWGGLWNAEFGATPCLADPDGGATVCTAAP